MPAYCPLKIFGRKIPGMRLVSRFGFPFCVRSEVHIARSLVINQSCPRTTALPYCKGGIALITVRSLGNEMLWLAGKNDAIVGPFNQVRK